MAGRIIGTKLESLRRCLARVTDKRAATLAELEADPDRQDVLVLNLSRAVQICVDIATHWLAEQDMPPPASMGEAFDGLARAGLIDEALCRALKSAVGFRNVAVHSYQHLSLAVVHAISWHHLTDFEHFARAIAGQISNNDNR